MIRSCVLGATGAVGTPVTNFLEKLGCVLKLDSKNCNLNCAQGVSDFKFTNIDVLVNASGTFGGLKSYESGFLSINDIYYYNLSQLIDQLNPSIIINISSAAASNSFNYNVCSPYFEYVKSKKIIENLVFTKSSKLIVNLRCTNIISKYENFERSGHSIASIYKKYLYSNDNNIEIWSNEYDWREYLDADDLVSLFPKILNLRGKYTFTIGSGAKTYMSDVVRSFNNHTKFNGKVLFNQPHKSGPLNYIVSLPIFLLGNEGIKITPIDFSIKKCIDNWGIKNSF